MTRAESTFPDFVSTRPAARWVAALLIATAAVSWIAAGVDLAEIRVLSRELGGETIGRDDRWSHALAKDVLLSARLALLVATGGAFLGWLYQSRINVRALGASGLDYTRAWSVGCFFVPLVNLVRPYQVIREIWKASDPEHTDPFDWREARTPLLLPLWWGAFVAYALLGLAAAAMISGASHDVYKLEIARRVALLANVAAAISASLAYFVVSQISDAQEAKAVAARG